MTTLTTLLDADTDEREKPIEDLSPNALAGLLVLQERSAEAALLAIHDHPEGHILRRALPSLLAVISVPPQPQ